MSTDCHPSNDDIGGAMKWCIQLFHEEKLMDELPEVVSGRSKLMGERIAEVVKDVINNFSFEVQDELYFQEEVIFQGEIEEPDVPMNDIEELDAMSDSDEESFPSSGENYSLSKDRNYHSSVPLELKKKVVEMARQHPTWSFATLRKRGGSALSRYSQIKEWERDIISGGNLIEKYQIIDERVFERFVEMRDSRKPVTTFLLKHLACAVAMQIGCTSFTASDSWVKKFKNRHNIRQRKITRFIKSKAGLDMKQIENNAEKFQKRLFSVIQKYDPRFVINSDQTGCEYRIPLNRTLSYRGEKTTEGYFGDFNKVTHSYTAQYALTAAGTILPKVFLCMQEPKGVFGPRVLQRVEQLSSEYGNISVTASKSGKLTKNHFHQFLNKVLMPYTRNNAFLFIADSWGGQTDISSIKEVFTDSSGVCTASVEIIPPHCTPMCQPCDVYFFRQVKLLIKKCKTTSIL